MVEAEGLPDELPLRRIASAMADSGFEEMSDVKRSEGGAPPEEMMGSPEGMKAPDNLSEGQAGQHQAGHRGAGVFWDPLEVIVEQAGRFALVAAEDQ